MAKTVVLKTTFGAGELQPELTVRRDTQQYLDGCKRLRNVRLLNSGAWTRRPGTWWLAELPGESRLWEFTFNVDQEYILAIGAGRMDAYLADGTPAGGLLACPWTAGQLASLVWLQSGDTVFIAHPDMPTQVVRRTGAGSWSRNEFDFDDGQNGVRRQPYYKFVRDAVTLQPSARDGDITVTASGVLWKDGHVGSRVRYVEREILITAIVSPTVAEGTVIEQLPRTQRLYCDNIDGFAIGDAVEGSVTGARGEIAAITPGDFGMGASGVVGAIDVLITDGDVEFSEAGGDLLVGPNARAGIEDETTLVQPAATRRWDEQVFSPVRGYAGCLTLHRDRLWFSGHRVIPSAVLASQVGAYFDFDIGTGEDDDGIFEFIGDALTGRVLHMISAEQLIITTDGGHYYVPETAASPLRPSSIAFFKISGDGGSLPPPGLFDDGVVVVERDGGRVVKLVATGDLQRSWAVEDLSFLSSHLIRAPRDSAFTASGAAQPERYGLFVNDDGTLAVLHAIAAQEVRGWTLWETAGQVRSVAALKDRIFVAVQRTVAGQPKWLLERFDQAVTLDAATSFTATVTTDVLGNATAAATVPRLALATATVVGNGYSFGEVAFLDLGEIALETAFAGPFVAGLYFASLCQTLPPSIALNDGQIGGRRHRICRVWVHVLDSALFRVDGQTITAWRGGEDVTAPWPQRSGPIEFRLMGWRREPTVTLTQDDPVPFTVLGLSMEIVT
jgi:hypothetical protein